jgi:hypothetical protein
MVLRGLPAAVDAHARSLTRRSRVVDRHLLQAVRTREVLYFKKSDIFFFWVLHFSQVESKSE